VRATLTIARTIANSVTWASNNVEGAYKRGVTIGVVIGWGNLQVSLTDISSIVLSKLT